MRETVYGGIPVPRHSHTDSVENLLFAKSRDLTPLLERCRSALDLDHEQSETMEDLLSRAWRIGGLFGQAHALRQLGGEGEEAQEPDLEAELQPLIEETIEKLDCTAQAVIAASTYLSEPIIAGAKAIQAETMASAIEHSHDLGGKAQEWLAKRGETGRG